MPKLRRWELIYPLYMVVFFLVIGYTDLTAQYPLLQEAGYAGLFLSSVGFLWTFYLRERLTERDSI
ncbi:hypothetical protein C447_13617 [Halococcus hamelinensis 100A6]|uniref:Uncharacterized protein n=1 Tax=Halococcus hamelinensis 100A6 TaxID=1132509 RepID=M0LTM3_9EURY|nr:hypothetical protein [Halococcus hamelinensis]EMA36907.1 hypothetical protein C447_13617 [Halococcus hamelinensis 100A6]